VTAGPLENLYIQYILDLIHTIGAHMCMYIGKYTYKYVRIPIYTHTHTHTHT